MQYDVICQQRSSLLDKGSNAFENILVFRLGRFIRFNKTSATYTNQARPET